MKLPQRAVVLVDLNPTLGREQRGVRPALVLGASDASRHQRYALLIVAPLTTTPLDGPLYPALEPTPQSGLRSRSRVLLDQLRAIDKQRVLRFYGEISRAEGRAVDDGLLLLFGL